MKNKWYSTSKKHQKTQTSQAREEKGTKHSKKGEEAKIQLYATSDNKRMVLAGIVVALTQFPRFWLFTRLLPEGYFVGRIDLLGLFAMVLRVSILVRSQLYTTHISNMMIAPWVVTG